MNWIKWNIWMPIRNAFVLLRGCKKRHGVSYPDLIDAMAGAVDKLEERTECLRDVKLRKMRLALESLVVDVENLKKRTKGFANQDTEQMRKDLEKLLPLMELLPLLGKYDFQGEFCSIRSNSIDIKDIKDAIGMEWVDDDQKHQRDDETVEENIPVLRIVKIGEKLAKLEKELNNLKDEINKPKPIPISTN